MSVYVQNDPITPIAENAIAHMNSDHADAVLAYARGIAGLSWAESATVECMDAAGLNLRVVGAGRQDVARIAFDTPLTDPAQLRPALVDMAQRARIADGAPDTIDAPLPLRDDQTADGLLNAIATRRSFAIKELAPDPIDLTLVAQMLEAANWAPSHGKTEPWRFVVYSDAARQIIGDAFAEAFCQINQGNEDNTAGARTHRERVWQAPVWIALGMQPNPKMPEWEELIAFGSAVQNAQLMASALGLASKWTSGACATHPHVAEVVGFAPETRLYGFLYVGLPAVPWPAGKRRSLAGKVRWMSEIG